MAAVVGVMVAVVEVVVVMTSVMMSWYWHQC